MRGREENRRRDETACANQLIAFNAAVAVEVEIQRADRAVIRTCGLTVHYELRALQTWCKRSFGRVTRGGGSDEQQHARRGLKGRHTGPPDRFFEKRE